MRYAHLFRITALFVALTAPVYYVFSQSSNLADFFPGPASRPAEGSPSAQSDNINIQPAQSAPPEQTPSAEPLIYQGISPDTPPTARIDQNSYVVTPSPNFSPADLRKAEAPSQIPDIVPGRVEPQPQALQMERSPTQGIRLSAAPDVAEAQPLALQRERIPTGSINPPAGESPAASERFPLALQRERSPQGVTSPQGPLDDIQPLALQRERSPQDVISTPGSSNQPQALQMESSPTQGITSASDQPLALKSEQTPSLLGVPSANAPSTLQTEKSPDTLMPGPAGSAEETPQVTVGKSKSMITVSPTTDQYPPEQARTTRSVGKFTITPASNQTPRKKDASMKVQKTVQQIAAVDASSGVNVLTLLTTGCYIQLGSYSKKSAATAAASAMPSMVFVYKADGSSLYKVMVGPFDLGDVGVQLLKLKRQGFSDAFVVNS